MILVRDISRRLARFTALSRAWSAVRRGEIVALELAPRGWHHEEPVAPR